MRGFKHFFSVLPIQTPQLILRGLGVQELMAPSLIDRPHGTGDHLFMFFYDPVLIGTGSGRLLYPAGTLVLWTPGRPQVYGNPEQPYRHSWVHCNGTFIRRLLRQNRLPRNRPFPLPDPSLMEQHLLAIHGEVTRHTPADRIIVGNLLENWLRATARQLRQKKAPTSVPKTMLAARHHIESDYEQPLALPELAAAAHLSVSHFSAEFKRYFGMAPIEYLIHHRMHRAAYLLRDQELGISDVGRRVGYEDPFHFSKLFKKHFGTGPREFRGRRRTGHLHEKPDHRGTYASKSCDDP